MLQAKTRPFRFRARRGNTHTANHANGSMLNINVAPLEDNMISVTKIHVLMRFAHRIIRPQPASAVCALPVANTSLSATACCWLSDHSIVHPDSARKFFTWRQFWGT